MKLFIDSNIFLSFYEFTSEDLTELDKLCRLIESNDMDLLLPQQVVDETWRKREETIDRSFTGFTGFRKKLSFRSFPSYCKNHNHYDSMRKYQHKLQDLHAEMVKDLERDIENQKLAADSLLQKLFGLATKLDRTRQLIECARQRVELGNPPGKRGSIGDALNWEALLSEVSTGERLSLISGDSDFASPLTKDHLRDFLRQEWSDRKNSELYFYRTLSTFFSKQSANINLKTETEKDGLIQDLTNSISFRMTHALIASLSEYEGFTQKQVEDLVDAVLTNSQVGRILGDEDVMEFYQGLYRKYHFYMSGNAGVLKSLLEGSEDHDTAGDEVPF